jgi:hypothetical protein
MDEFKNIFLKSGFKQQNKLFIQAAGNGENTTLIWMANTGNYNLNKAMWAACNHRHTETMNLLYGMGAKMSAGYFVSAVLKNWMDVAMWLYTIDPKCIDDYMYHNWFYLMVPICNNRQMAMLNWLLEKYNVRRDQLIQSIIHEDVKRFLESEYSNHSGRTERTEI